MGEFSLACLLGQYDRAQSFDVDSFAPVTHVQSWAKADQTSWYFSDSQSPTQVHSSGQALRIEVFSRSGGVSILEYAHGAANDAHARWFPQVDTHIVESALWTLLDPLPSSGGLRFEVLTGADVALPIPGASLGSDPLAFRQLTTTTVSDGAASPRVAVRIPSGSSIASDTVLLVDDVMTAVDPIVLHPEWSFQERARLLKAEHRTMGGDLHSLVWNKYFAYRVPLRFLADSEADLINWWWGEQLALQFTLDTSDSESRYIVRIVNDVQPIGGRMRPNENLWQGTLLLESINRGDLRF